MTDSNNTTAAELRELIKTPHIVVVHIYAQWCQICQYMYGVFKYLAKDYPDYHMVTVDIDDFPEVISPLEINTVPTLLRYEAGEETARIELDDIPDPKTMRDFVEGKS